MAKGIARSRLKGQLAAAKGILQQAQGTQVLENWLSLDRVERNACETQASNASKALHSVHTGKAPSEDQLHDIGVLALRGFLLEQVLFSHICHNEGHPECDDQSSWYNSLVPWCEAGTTWKHIRRKASVHSCFKPVTASGRNVLRRDPLTEKQRLLRRRMVRRAYPIAEVNKTLLITTYVTSAKFAGFLAKEVTCHQKQDILA